MTTDERLAKAVQYIDRLRTALAPFGATGREVPDEYHDDWHYGRAHLNREYRAATVAMNATADFAALAPADTEPAPTEDTK